MGMSTGHDEAPPAPLAVRRRCELWDLKMNGGPAVFDTESGRPVFPAPLARIAAGRRLALDAAARPANLVLFDVLSGACRAKR